jgi:hypothetical protein
MLFVGLLIRGSVLSLAGVESTMAFTGFVTPGHKLRNALMDLNLSRRRAIPRNLEPRWEYRELAGG